MIKLTDEQAKKIMDVIRRGSIVSSVRNSLERELEAMVLLGSEEAECHLGWLNAGQPPWDQWVIDWKQSKEKAEYERRERLLWIRQRFGADAQIAGECACGNKMGETEYSYNGGSVGCYRCSVCDRDWLVDLNGAMRPAARG